MITSPLLPFIGRQPRQTSLGMEPTPPPVPVNANVTHIILTAGGDVLMLFDLPVIVDPASPPASWTFNGQPIDHVEFNAGTASELVVAGAVVVGDSAVIGDSDPGARTVDGGYVNGLTTGVSAG